MYLLDSDAAKKLAQYDLLGYLTNAYQCELSDIAILPQLKFQLKLNNPTAALRKLGSEDAVIAAHALITSATEVSITNTSANPFLALSSPDIDSGEQVLFAAIYERDEYELISGDKRAYIALSKIQDQVVTEGIWSRLICLEEAVYAIVTTQDFSIASRKIRSRPDVDISLSIIFGRTTPNTLEDVKKGLMSYLKDLAVNTQNKYILPIKFNIQL